MGRIHVLRALAVTGAFSGCLLATTAATPTDGMAPADGREVLEAALRRMGGEGLLERSGGVAFHASGWMDKASERQGRSASGRSRGPFVERLAIDADGGQVGYEYREDRYDGTWEELREIYSGDDRRLIVVLSAGFVVDLRSEEHARARRKLLRRFPTLLLAELAARPEEVRFLDGGETRGDTLRLSAALEDGTRLDLHFSRADTLLRRASYAMDYLSYGDTEVSWSYDDYRSVEGLGWLPHRYGVSIGGRPFTEMKVLRVQAGPSAVEPYLAVPEGFRMGEPQRITPVQDASTNARVDTLGPGIFRIRNLRGGFHPLFLRVGEGLLAVDAPAGYPLPNELPAGDVAPGPSSDWLSERYLELMRQTVPGVPVSHMVLTHFHNDHGGGLRAFVAEGATVVASSADTAAVRQYVQAPHTLAPDRLSSDPRPLRMEAVDGRWTLESGGRRVDVLEVGPNPHTEGMLVLHLPREGVMFVSDLFDPTGDPMAFPSASHAALDAWFGMWLREHDLAPERIYTMHGSGRVTPEHLARLDSLPAPTLDVEWIERDRAIPFEPAAGALVEPHVAVDPSDPEHFTVGTIVVDGDRDPWHCAVFTTFDGGESWSGTELGAMDGCIDPWAVLLPDGTGVLTGIEVRSGAEPSERLRLVLFGSSDGGRSWTANPEALGFGFDHSITVPGEDPSGPLILASRRNVHPAEGRRHHRISVGRLDPARGTFEESTSLLPAVVGMTVTGVAPLSDGSLVVTYWDNQRDVDGFRREGMLDRGRAWALRSTDSGRTFGPPHLLGDHCASGGPERAFPGYPGLAVGGSGEGDLERIHHACVRPGLDGIAVSHSDDGGRRWSDPQRVDRGSPHARTPMIAADGRGTVVVAWYDRRLDPEEECQDLYMSASVDGGTTFGRPRRVSTETSCPAVPGNEGVVENWPMGGDYGSLAAAADGSFHLVWADSRDGAFSLRRTRFRIVRRATAQESSGAVEPDKPAS